MVGQNQIEIPGSFDSERQKLKWADADTRVAGNLSAVIW
jgi:hypothetical protein